MTQDVPELFTHGEVMNILRNLSMAFSQDELATLMLQKVNEKAVQNKITYQLNQLYEQGKQDSETDLLAVAEWNPKNWLKEEHGEDVSKPLPNRAQVDIAALELFKNTIPFGIELKSLIEIKVAYSNFLLKKREKDTIWKYSNGKGVMADIEKMENINLNNSFNHHQIQVLINPRSKLDEGYQTILKDIKNINNCLDDYGDHRRILDLCKEKILKKLEKADYIVDFVTIYGGEAYGVGVDIMFAVISKENKIKIS